MVACVAEEDAEHALKLLTAEGENAWILGRIEDSSEPPSVVINNG
jgi:phosphoribosylaminoimidazole (AIR) synthetase